MEDLSKKVALTPNQQRAFNEFKAAFKKCKSAGIRFEMQEDTLIALNGRNVQFVTEGTPQESNEFNLQDFVVGCLDTSICPYIDCEVTVTVKA